MPPVTTKQIRELGRDIVLKNPGGVRFAEIVRQIRQAFPDAPVTTIAAQIANYLIPAFPNEITKPSRGLYKPLVVGNGGEVVPPVVPVITTPTGFQREEEVYQPFADWLQNDIEEATEAVALGGAGLKAKWGTPDVVGVYRPLTADLIKFSPEIVAVEIKLDPTQSIVAFGQAIAYRLFATRSYLVMPSTIGEEDSSRLDSLCLLFGIGFVLFDPSTKDPDFQIRVRAQRFTPDAFYVNEFATRLQVLAPDRFKKLFG